MRITGLKEFGKYLNKLFTIDAFFLNEDRHTHNIAVLMNAFGKFAYCPIFDQGAGLLSDMTMDYPLDEDISEKLCGRNLKFSFTKQDVKELLQKADIYPEKIRCRVENIINEQMRKYEYLFQ